ncbi:DMT family transporter [Paracoccus aminophilus]|uniref:EamA domain-containing protein n=1 Tax=Paracoccus aminophilus JCM 7686 TaxID=1367847 RepID=S5XJL6_PARAH|nr:DMT family transporter [Paracoccus aminophilus]AGT07379.1 hypothetical protein JCM7686_0268 [Paracoccus aminophilus JCM 7686]
MSARDNLRGALVALLSMGIYTTHDVIIKHLGAEYAALQILFFTSLLSFPLLSVVLLSDPTPGPLRPKKPLWVAVRACSTMGAMICGFYAFSHLPLAQVYALLFASPLLITLLTVPFLGETVGPHRLGAVVVGLAGVLVVLRPGQSALEFAHLAAFGGACCTAMGAIALRKLGRGERRVVLLLWPILGNLVLAGVSLAFTYRPMELPHLALAGVIAFLSLCAGFLMILAYQLGEATVVAPMQYSQIIWASVYGWLFFSETMDGMTLIGSALIIASGLYILMRERGAGARATAVGARLGPG